MILSSGTPESWIWLYGFAAVFGHCYSPWLKFNGGKGVATSAGVMIVLHPQWAAVALGFFLITRILMGRWGWPEAGMIGSVATWVFFAGLMAFHGDVLDARNAGLMTLFLMWRHQQNFRNLWALR